MILARSYWLSTPYKLLLQGDRGESQEKEAGLARAGEEKSEEVKVDNIPDKELR
jgi:hypothetical protein